MMSVFLWSVGICVLSLAAHLLLWRIRLPKRQSRALAMLFLGALFLGGGLALLLGPGPYVPPWPYGILRMAFFVGVVMCSYILSYPAVEVDSPTVTIVLALMKGGDTGISEKELYAAVSDDVLVIPRLHDMLRDGMAVLDAENRYKLTPKGRIMSRFFSSYRSALGLAPGG